MIQIAIAGSSDKEPLKTAVEKAIRFAKALPIEEVILLTGGRGGIMEIVSREFSKRGGIVVGILPYSDRGNEFNTIRIKTGLNPVERSGVLIESADVLVVLGGGVGTMIEALMAYNLGVPVIVLTNTGYASDKLEKLAEDGYFDHKKIVKITFIDNPEKAAQKAVEIGRERK
ncbi:TIGR00725 family protein [Pyrococcus furiosus DSM 3638]|nr:TIGR00725 family protein [Pyrococcus furiosus]AFN04410.1 oxidoreductase [Pyrococcus furiosus COM1]QEK79674.1 TIGR00725 family protein [Pyrococcus furiosus DSM 3638]